MLRIPGLFNDLWLDEIWTLGLLLNVSGPGDILFRLHHENNHIVNTLYAYAIGEGARAWAYRGLSFASGILTLLVTMWISERNGQLHTLTAVFLCGLSYPLIHYSSEARGYALAVCMAMLSFHFLEHYLTTKKPLSSIFYQSTLILGLFSHLTFVYFFLSAVLWTLITERAKRTPIGPSLAAAVKLNGFPAGVLALYYLADIRHMVSGGAPETEWEDMVLRTFALALGAPGEGSAALWATLLAAALFFGGMSILKKERSARWSFYFLIVFFSPVCMFLVANPKYHFARYLLISVPFFLLVVAHVLCRCYGAGIPGKAVYIACLICFAVGNLAQVADFVKDGRGHYAEALKFMTEHPEGGGVTVAGDHDFRVGVVVAYYVEQMGLDKSLVYLNVRSYPKEGTTWFISHGTGENRLPEPVRMDIHHNVYQLRKEFRHAGLSGMDWFVYQKTASATSS